jgi:PAS domain S-box-containing protein
MSFPPEYEMPDVQVGEMLAAVLRASNEAIFTKSLDGLITSWGHGAELMYGFLPDEILGLPVTVLMPPGRKHEAEELIAAVREGRTVSDYHTERVTKNGVTIRLNLTVMPIVSIAGHVNGALTVARNLSYIQDIERYVQALSDRERDHLIVLNAAQRVALDIVSSQTGLEALRNIAEAARALTDAKYAAIGVARPDGHGLLEFVTVGLSPEEEERIGNRPRGVGVLGLLLNRSEPLRIDSLGDHASSAGFPPNHPEMKSFLGVPIKSADAVIGSLYLTEKEGGKPFTIEDEIAVSAIGAQAAVSIHNLLLLARQRSLVQGLIMAQEEERQAMAYDLHDGLTQFVMASHAHLESFKAAHAKGNVERADRELEIALKYLKEAVLESRRMVNGLRTLALDDLGLAGAMEQSIEEERRRAGWIDADFVHNIAGERFDQSIETTVYRVAQEALTNARKHARTSRVLVTLILDERPASGSAPRRLRLEVRDWGVGFDAEQARRDDSRVGLHSMFERVHNVGGEWTLESTIGKGTIVRAIVVAQPPMVDAPTRDME